MSAAATLLAIFAASSAMSAAFNGAAGMAGRAAQAGTQASGASPLSTLDPTDAAPSLAVRNLAEALERQRIATDDDALEQAGDQALRRAISPAEREELSGLAQQAPMTALQNPEAGDGPFAAFTQRAFSAARHRCGGSHAGSATDQSADGCAGGPG
jgi:hypothetical protein